MNINDYLDSALNTESNDFQELRKNRLDNTTIRLIHGLLGLQTELGELADPAKKYIFYGRAIDKINMLEEIGDMMWYLAILVDELTKGTDTKFSDLLQTNIDKLRARYPNKFTEFDALNRKLDVERNILEGK